MISSNFLKRLYTSLLLFVLLFLIFRYNLILTFSILLIGIFSVIEFSFIIKKILKKKISIFLSNISFICYVAFLCTFFVLLSFFIKLKIIIFIVLLGCIASDIGGYLIGKLIKGPKLTKISPNKTLAGAVGSIIFTNSIIILLCNMISVNINYKIIIAATTTSIFCQLGDLLFSYLKRKAEIKDTGNFLPGHGGILDRLDGVLVGLPIGVLTLILSF